MALGRRQLVQERQYEIVLRYGVGELFILGRAARGLLGGEAPVVLRRPHVRLEVGHPGAGVFAGFVVHCAASGPSISKKGPL
ncbi:MAG TPA: hypothetical protein VFN61_14905 [Acidimicrobiales bacterium]|nr:hypothetical protein [Acidimicrobiales bacterium]